MEFSNDGVYRICQRVLPQALQSADTDDFAYTFNAQY